MKKIKSLCLICIIALITCSFLPSVNAKTKTKIAISDKKISIEVGEEYQLSVTGTKSKVTWSSADKSVATVSSDGFVDAISVGKTKVTGKIGTKKYSCQVTVKESTLVTLELKNDVYAKNFYNFIYNALDISSTDDNDDYFEISCYKDSYDENVLKCKNGIDESIKKYQPYDASFYRNDDSYMSYTVSCKFKEVLIGGTTINTQYSDKKIRNNFLSSIYVDVFELAYLTGNSVDTVSITFIDTETGESYTSYLRDVDGFLNYSL